MEEGNKEGRRGGGGVKEEMEEREEEGRGRGERKRGEGHEEEVDGWRRRRQGDIYRDGRGEGGLGGSG